MLWQICRTGAVCHCRCKHKRLQQTKAASPAHSSSTQSIRQHSASAAISLEEIQQWEDNVRNNHAVANAVANIFFPTLNLFQLWRNEISNLEEEPSLSTSAFYARSMQQSLCIVLNSQFSPNFTESSQLVTPNGHDLFAMALETQDLPSQNQFGPNVFQLPKCKKTMSILQCQATSTYLNSI